MFWLFLTKVANQYYKFLTASRYCSRTGFKKLNGKNKHLFILGRKFVIMKEWKLNILSKTMNYFNNDKTSPYFYIRKYSLNKVLEMRKD